MVDFLKLIGGVIIEYDILDDDDIGPIQAFVVQQGTRFYHVSVGADGEFNAGGVLHTEDITGDGFD